MYALIVAFTSSFACSSSQNACAKARRFWKVAVCDVTRGFFPPFFLFFCLFFPFFLFFVTRGFHIADVVEPGGRSVKKINIKNPRSETWYWPGRRWRCILRLKLLTPVDSRNQEVSARLPGWSSAEPESKHSGKSRPQPCRNDGPEPLLCASADFNQFLMIFQKKTPPQKKSSRVCGWLWTGPAPVSNAQRGRSGHLCTHTWPIWPVQWGVCHASFSCTCGSHQGESTPEVTHCERSQIMWHRLKFKFERCLFNELFSYL